MFPLGIERLWLRSSFACFGVFAFVLIIAFAFPLSCANGEGASSDVVASAPDGFTVTVAQVEEMKKFFTEHTAFEAPDEEIKSYTVCAYLLAREADREHLSTPQDFRPVAPVHTVLAKAQAYFDQALKNYVLDPLVVESYYKAHFEDFNDLTQGVTSDNSSRTAELLPPVHERVKEKLLQMKQAEIASSLCRDLKSKYAVTERGARE